MEIAQTILHIVEIVLLGVVALFALLAALLVTISLLPKDNPLRQLLVAFTKPVGVMAGVSAAAIPIEFIPVVDMIYDLAAFAGVIYAWYCFLCEAKEIWPRFGEKKNIEHDPHPVATDLATRAYAAQQRGDLATALSYWMQAADHGHQAAHIFIADIQAEMRQPKPDSSRMTRAKALEVLQLSEPATRETVNQAFMRLMQRVHPDKGGSDYFAKELNQAREVLMA